MKCIPIPVTSWRAIKAAPYIIYLAETFCQKQQGLQGQSLLPANALLFFKNIPPGVFFHMRNCSFPIDIIPVDRDNRVLSVWHAVPGQEQIGPMPRGTKHVIEVNSGWAERLKLKIGDLIPFINI